MKKKILSVIIVMSMLCAFLPVMVNAATNGTCGENLTWVLDSEGTLTISGEGEMESYSEGGAPWYSERKNIITK